MNDNTASTVVIDSKLLGDGTSVRNTSLMHVDGKIGGALDFNGTSDYVDCNQTFQSTFQNSFTINLWCKVTDGTGVRQYLLDVYKSSVFPAGSFQITFFLTFQGRLEGAYVVNNYSVGAMEDVASFVDGQNDWKMVTLVATKVSTTTGNLTLYINGSLAKQGNTGNVSFGDYVSNLNLHIGAMNNGGTPAYFFTGSLDDFMIFNRALTAAEVLFLYENVERPIINSVVDGGDEDSVVINITSAGTSQLYYREKFATSWTTGLTDDSEGTIIQTGLTAGKWYEFYVIDDETNRPSNLIECEVIKNTILIESAIYSLLKNNDTINRLVSSRIYPNLIPQAAIMPAITYQQISGVREHTADGADGFAESRFQINCWDSSYSGAKILAEAVRKKLDGYKGTVGTRKIQSCFLVDEDDMPQVAPETDVLQRHGKRLDFVLMYDESLT